MDKNYKTIVDPDGVIELIQYIENGDIISFDTETTTLNPRSGEIIGFSVSANIGEGYYFPTRIWNPETKTLDNLQINEKNCDDIAKYVINLLKKKRLVMHNGSFDIRYVKNFYDIDLRDSLYVDTLLLRHMFKEDGPLSLKETAIELQAELGIDAEKEANQEQLELKESIKRNGGSVSKANFEIFKADMQILSKYAAADTDLTLRVLTYYLPKLKDDGLWEFFFEDEVMPLYKTVTIKMEEVGTKLNIPLIEETDAAIQEDMKKLESGIINDLMNIPEVQNWILDTAQKKFPPKKRGAFGKLIKTLPVNDAKKVEKFLESGDPMDLHPTDAAMTSLELYKQKEGALINISSKKQLGDICFNFLGEKPLSKTKKGNSQFNDGMIEDLSEKYEWASKLRTYNKLSKIKSSYIDRFKEGEENGRYYWYFKQHGTTSGRFSSDSQQLPRVLEEQEASELVRRYNNIVRSFLVAEDGRKFVICDQSSLEPRVFATVSNDPNLINVFINNEDLYSRVAIQAFKLKDVSANKQDENFLKKVRPDLRQKAKSIALAIPYGAGAWQIGQSLNIGMKEAQRLIDGYLEGFPELAKWMLETNLKAKTEGYVMSKTGRIRHLDKVKYWHAKLDDGLIDPKTFRELKKMVKTKEQEQKLMQARMEYKNGLNNAKNFQIQSLAASIMNRSAIAIHKEFAEKNLDAHIMLQIHDEFVVNSPAEIAEQVADIVKHHMENTVQIATGLIAEPNIADSFAEGHE